MLNNTTNESSKTISKPKTSFHSREIQTTKINKQNSTNKNIKFTQLPKVRLLMVWLAINLGIFGLGLRLYQLQVLDREILQQRAYNRQTVELKPYTPRRSIIDRHNNILATDKLVYILYIHPNQFKQSKEATAAIIAPILETTEQELLKKFNQKSGIRLISNLTEDAAKKIISLRLDGLDIRETYSRKYPYGNLVSEVVGFVNFRNVNEETIKAKGQAGVEYTYQKQLELPTLIKKSLLNSEFNPQEDLKKDQLTHRVERTGKGHIQPSDLPTGLFNSDRNQLKLTIDLRLQRAARKALKKQMTRYRAKKGTVIVMDVSDGSLLTLVNEPSYDPNKYWEYDAEYLKNWVVTDAYEPGSTFKSINVALALDAKVITPNTYINDTGKMKINGWYINNANHKANGWISIAEVLQKSSNIAMIDIINRIDKLDYYYKLKDLGLGEKIGVDLPSEASGHLKSKWVFIERDIEAATASFGQGFSLTPLKLVQLNAAIANGGKLVTPHVVEGIVDFKGDLQWEPSFETKQVFSPESSQAVLKMMESVVEEGTGKTSRIPGHRIGGKTGTAQKAEDGRYLYNAKITSFVAIMPVNKPRYVVLAVVDEPQGWNTYGSTVAAPIVKEVIESLISLEGIPPSKPFDTEDQ